ncbi:PREDICTED: LOW QUALITY PROTEIN: uncharacterized protein LOC105365017 [Ceratosolen solmsi marchali]|uniref:MOG interacting and ectopic P-granules protein 1 n=1 Tax=Ceratosolen solmsi marchali TaxID=326594 RepID=A0AAJ7DYS7_9HYME|nr:PREDICTED: LOW QUALITY PROTEIN: uncharacterized protein LOC105365017 [Ceratosolen solmsi marchali]
MEGSSEELLVKDPSHDDTDSMRKDRIPNGMNGGYDVGNDDGISSSGRHLDKVEHLDKCDSSGNVLDEEEDDDEDEEDEEEEDMEIDSKDVESNEANSKSLTDLANSYSALAGIPTDHTSVNKDVNSAVSDKNEKLCDKDSSLYESMDVDARSNASDIECLGDDSGTVAANDYDSENDEEDDEDEMLSDSKLAGSSQGHVKNPSASSDDVQHLDQSAEIIDSSLDTSDVKICEENGSLGSPDIEEITDGGKSNGHNSSSDSFKETPKKKNKKAVDLSNITPRRSSRNINRKSYMERELEEDSAMVVDNNSDIEEIKPEDPLAEVDSKDKENSKLKSPIKNISTSNNKTTIVVNDTKRLVEIAAGSKNIKGGKKEPTLVIIDTNSILSGKGGVPVTSPKSSQHQSSHLHHAVSSSSSFSVMPIGMGPQQIYANTRTTITPVPMKTPQISSPKSTTITPVINPHHQQHQHQHPSAPTTATTATAAASAASAATTVTQILPTLTDDMFVVEAPSFIVPYVYEKPPLKPLKDFVGKLEKSIEEYEKEEKLRKQAEKEKNKMDDDKEDDEDKDSDYEDKKDDESVELSEKISNLEDKTEFIMQEDKNKIPSYFDLPLGKFFMSIGIGLVQEYVQTDLLRTQKRKQGKGSTSAETQMAINSLIKNLEFSKENNEPFHLELKKCEFCSFKTESALAMQHHLETPHMRNYVYKCNFCPVEVRSPHDILFHMEAEHNTRGRLERGPAFHQCPNCPFEDNQKGKLTRHILACTKKFRPERNLEPSMDWEPPAKIPRLNRPRNMGGPQLSANALAMAMGAKGPQPLLPKLLPAPITGRGRGRPPMQPRYTDMKTMRPGGSPGGIRQDNVSSMMYRPTSSGLLVPTSYQFGSNQIFQNTSVTNAVKNPTAKLLSQPSISITPLPRTTPQPSVPGSGNQTKPGGKSTFVICEICDGYIKDLEQLRNHMQWIHKVKIHPKMIYNRPPLNCQKCQFRFFTDQGLERHLLGSHGLVTSSMQEAANKGKDSGRCPACGRVYQWKLLNHVARDHGMTLKPAHLSYKCTVCTATFGMYKQFENHVYSAHSVVAKRVMDKKSSAPSSPSSRSNDSLLKPLKINDEITIIPQPAKPTTRSGGPQGRTK